MQLELGDRSVRHPSAQQVEEALAGLPLGSRTGVMLSRGPLTWLRATGDRETGFALEYQDGSAVEHYHSVVRTLPFETALAVFRGYAARDPAWRETCAWHRESLPLVAPRGKGARWIVVGAALLAGLLALWRCS